MATSFESSPVCARQTVTGFGRSFRISGGGTQ